MMPHMLEAARNPVAATVLCRFRDPDYLAKAARERNDGWYALCSIAARGNWMLVNGHWLPKQEDGVRLYRRRRMRCSDLCC